MLASAIALASDGATIVVTAARAADGTLSVHVHNETLDLTADARERLMQPFAALELPRSPWSGDVGLSLALAKHFVDFHSGTFALAAEAGNGLAIIARFPRARTVG